MPQEKYSEGLLEALWSGNAFGESLSKGARAVFVFSAMSLIVAMAIYSVDTQPLLVIPQILAIALAVSVVEAASVSWTDNFLIPLVTAFLAWFLIFPATPLLLP